MTCIGRDPLCPCADGDACHYRDTPTTKGWPTFSQADIDAAVAAERERIAAHFDARDFGVGGFYDAHEPAQIIRTMDEVDENAKLHRKEVDDMAEMHKPHLIERLRECLPTAADGPDHRVWCNVRGSDLREAVAEIAVQREALTAAMDELERVRAEVAALRKSRNDDGHLVLFVERAIREKP